MSDEFIQLNRSFLPISNLDEAEAALNFETRVAFGIASNIHWDDLLEEPRVVILAEAGAGKTYEIRNITKRLRDEGKQAFFLRLEYLRKEFELAFEGGAMGEFSDFSSWTQTAEKAWFFLDSVDEAKLRDPGDFETALRRFQQRLGDRIHHINIVITSRPTWEPKTEFSLVKRLLPYHPNKVGVKLTGSEENPTDSLSQSDYVSIQSPREISDNKQYHTVYSLAPLNNEQIKLFAATKGVSDTNHLLEAIHRADALLFAARPQDLTDLIAYWAKHGKIGTRLELVKASVDQKLVESDMIRAELKPLAYEKALSGAKLVAAATTLTSYSRVAVPEKERIPEAIPILEILKDWKPSECKSLLERPIFDEAVYGTVRFHHRSVREYLVSQLFVKLLSKGSRRRVESLFFREQYGEKLITPSLRSILPWIAIGDDQFRQKALRIAPEVLLEGGDPSQFPASVRSDILESLCQEMAVSKSRHYSFDIAAVERFASLDIEKTISRLLDKYHDASEIRTLLLRMVWQGKITSCMKHAIPFIKDRNYERYTRICAIRAIDAAGTSAEKQDVVNYFVNTSDEIDFSILNSIIESFGFSELSAANLQTILDRLPYPGEFKLEHLDYTLKDLMGVAPFPDLEIFVESLAALLAKEPHVERKYCAVSKQHAWLVPIAVKCCARLISKRSAVMLTPSAIDLLVRCSSYRDYHSENDSSAPLSELVPQWSALSERLFWRAVSRARVELNQDVPRIMQISYYGAYWSYEGIGLETAIDWVKIKSEMRDRRIALSFAFKAYVREGRERKSRETLKKAVSGISELECALQKYLRPPPQSEEEKKWKRTNRHYLQQTKQRKEKAAQRKKGWKTWLSGHLDNIADTQLVQEGKFYNSQRYLYERLKDLSTDEHKWAYGNWQDLIGDQSLEVAEAFRDFLVACWQQYQPAIRSEGIENPNNTSLGVVFGLCGLSIESSEVSRWPSNLTITEAEHAVRYSLWEINGLPDWLQSLHARFPKIVEEHFLQEIEWELAEHGDDKFAHYVLDSLVWHGEWLRGALSGSVFELLHKNEPKSAETLHKALVTVLASDQVSDDALATLAKNKIGQSLTHENLAIWFALWVSVSPHKAISRLGAYLAAIADDAEATEFAMKFIVNLVGGRRFHYRNAREKHKCVKYLERLYLLMHQYIRASEDINRSGGGVYSPGLRDDAQDARNALFSQLQQIPGKASYLALKKIASEHPDEKSRAWMQVHVKDRAEQDADIGEWSVRDVIGFADDQERKPGGAKELYELSVERLLDLKHDLENGEDSVAATWQRETEETKLRILIAKWLREHASGKYSVHQEEEQADAKRPDIRTHGFGFDAPVPIELKIVDNNWSGRKLFERLENQLCNDYLRDYRTTFGIFLLVYRGEAKRWEHPSTKKRMSFGELVETLQNHAKDYIQNRAEIDNITVVGIALAARMKPVRFDKK